MMDRLEGLRACRRGCEKLSTERALEMETGEVCSFRSDICIGLIGLVGLAGLTGGVDKTPWPLLCCCGCSGSASDPDSIYAFMVEKFRGRGLVTGLTAPIFSETRMMSGTSSRLVWVMCWKSNGLEMTGRLLVLAAGR